MWKTAEEMTEGEEKMEKLLLNVSEVNKVAGKKQKCWHPQWYLTHNTEQVMQIMQRIKGCFANQFEEEKIWKWIPDLEVWVEMMASIGRSK